MVRMWYPNEGSIYCKHNWCLRGKAEGVHVSYCTNCSAVRIMTNLPIEVTDKAVEAIALAAKIEVK